MIVFQWIMLPVMLILTGIFFQKLKHQPLLRTIVMLVMLTGMIFLVFPDWSTILASYIGIGRGVDLIIYLSLLALTLASILLYLRTVDLQKKIEALVRKDALDQALQEKRDDKD
ncbi:MAG: DUF2304 domain-containing protein [Bacteroidia bacterium]|nr:DUF2304 domain-containing protein [Bacteroidia bacterium]